MPDTLPYATPPRTGTLFRQTLLLFLWAGGVSSISLFFFVITCGFFLDYAAFPNALIPVLLIAAGSVLTAIAAALSVLLFRHALAVRARRHDALARAHRLYIRLEKFAYLTGAALALLALRLSVQTYTPLPLVLAVLPTLLLLLLFSSTRYELNPSLPGESAQDIDQIKP
jgi:hypothetical protein